MFGWRCAQARVTSTASALALALALLVLGPRDASAGNLDTFMLGNDAAMMGGAVTATAKGSSAVWYNPAGVVGDEYHSVDVAFNAYLLRFGTSPDITVDESNGGTRTQLTNLDVSPIPTALAYTRRVLGWDIGAGLFVPNRGVSFPRTLVRLRSGDRVSSVARDGNDRFSEYYAGLAAGRSLTPRFRIGLALFGYYSSQVDTDTIYAGVSGSSGESFALSHTTTDQLRLGYQAVWGLQWSPHDDWQLGVTFRSPVVQAYEQTQTASIEGFADPTTGEVTSAAAYDEKATTTVAVLRPMRAHVGAGWKHERWQVGLDASVQAPHSATLSEDSTRTVWNVRGGVLRTVSEKLAFGGGLFTDRSPYSADVAQARGSLDYYGVAVALRLGELLTVRSADDPKERPLIFGSTFAVSYAIGTGTIGNQQLEATSGGGARTSLRPDSITAHEFVFHVGSTLSR
jgi:hypothetical protein